MLSHWSTRQAAGATPFYFTNANELAAAGRHYAKAAAHAAAGPSNQSAPPQDAHEAQAGGGGGLQGNGSNDPDEIGDGNPSSVSLHLVHDNSCS